VNLQRLTLIASGEANHRLGEGVNDGGDAIGSSGPYFDSGDPVKWPVGGIEVLPAPSGGASGPAMDINKQGWIVGAVFDNTNRCNRAAIWRQR
jgi:hypothetical protein